MKSCILAAVLFLTGCASQAADASLGQTACGQSVCDFGEKCSTKGLATCVDAWHPGQTVCNYDPSAPNLKGRAICEFDQECKVSPEVTVGGVVTVPASSSCVSKLKKGETKCGTYSDTQLDDGTRVIKWNTQDICKWWEECVDEEEQFRGVCVAKGNSICYKTVQNGDDTIDVPWRTCEPYESCCDGRCCASNEACVTASAASNRPYRQYFTNRTDKTLKGPDDQDVTYEQLDRMGWEMPDGTEIDLKESICSAPDALVPLNGVRVIAMPLFSTIFLLVFTAVCAKNFGLDPKAVRIPALLVFVVSVFLVFSTMWPFAFVGALTAALTFAAPDKNQGWLIIWQIISLFVMLSSFTFVSVNPASGTNFLFASSSGGILDASQTSCTRYFSYFTFGDSKAWDMNPATDAYGYCHQNWLVGVVFFTFCSVLFQFVTLVFTVAEYGQKQI